MADLRAAAELAFPIALALTPFWGGLFWAGPSNLWIFLGTPIPLFLVFHAMVKHVRPLKRIFISDMEGDKDELENLIVERSFTENG